MRYIRYSVLIFVGLVLFTVALANRGPVTVRLVPDDAAGLLPMAHAYTIPVFALLFGGIVLGLLIGFFWEWAREHKHRAEASQRRREAQALKQEVKGLKAKTGEGKDDVLALLE